MEGEDRFLLDPPEGIRPVFVEDLLEHPPGPLLDQEIRIDKPHAEGFCKDDAHRALPRTGHADEDDVSLVLHTASRWDQRTGAPASSPVCPVTSSIASASVAAVVILISTPDASNA